MRSSSFLTCINIRFLAPLACELGAGGAILSFPRKRICAKIGRFLFEFKSLLSSPRKRGSRGSRTSSSQGVEAHVVWPLDSRFRGDDMLASYSILWEIS